MDDTLELKKIMQRRLAVISRHLKPCNLAFSNVSAGIPRNYPSYRYTLDDGTLTIEQRDFFEQNGFLVIRGLVPLKDLKRYEIRFQEICNGKDVPPMLTIMKDIKYRNKDGEFAINKIQDFQLDTVLSDYYRLPQVLKIVQNFTGPDIKAVHSMLINKPPDSGSKSSRHPLHQDLHYFPFRPADRIVASWTAMERVNRQNGCLVVYPESHKEHLLEHKYPDWEGGVNKMYHGIQNYDPDIPKVYLEMEAGDTVFFHPLLIHGSGSNKTDGFRKAISCHFASSHCHYINDEDVEEGIASEMTSIAKRRIGDDIKFSLEDIWRIKSVLVQGKEGTL